jgi:hypothetical protein
MAGFWSAVALADLELPAPLTWGVVKGLLLRNLRWWTQQPDILTHQGTLTIGYCYPNQFTSENYNSPGSPYWFMLSFLALACPDSHPLWQAEEEAYPAASLSTMVALKQPNHIMVRMGGHTFLLSSGQRCHYPMRAAQSKYCKFAYSSAFGYSVPTGGYFVQAIGGDNMLALSDDEGETWKVRGNALNARIEDREGALVLISSWKPWANVEIETFLLPPTDQTPNWHLRVHRLKTGRGLKTSEGAFALNGEREEDGRELATLATDGHEGRQELAKDALVISRSGAVGITDLVAAERQGKVLDEDANSNLIWSRSVLPTLGSTLEAGASTLYVTAVYAIPESARGWRETWSTGWRERPVVPSWIGEL